MRSHGWALFPCDWCPYKSGNVIVDTYGKTEKMVIYKAGVGSWARFLLIALGRKRSCQPLDPGVLASRTVDSKFTPPSLWFTITVVLANECRMYSARTSWKKIKCEHVSLLDVSSSLVKGEITEGRGGKELTCGRVGIGHCGKVQELGGFENFKRKE